MFACFHITQAHRQLALKVEAAAAAAGTTVTTPKATARGASLQLPAPRTPDAAAVASEREAAGVSAVVMEQRGLAAEANGDAEALGGNGIAGTVAGSAAGLIEVRCVCVCPAWSWWILGSRGGGGG